MLILMIIPNLQNDIIEFIKFENIIDINIV